MSSHHIVRDMQEPALLIADGEPCELSVLESMLEWSPIIVALDEAYLKLQDLGIKVDYWLGDFDNIDPEKVLLKLDQPDVKVVHTLDQNKTDLEKGIEFLISKNATAINIVWAMGRRMDHALSNISSVAKYSQKVEIVLFDSYSKFYFLKKTFTKWYKKGQIISLIPFPVAKNIKSTGLKYPLNNEDLELGVRLGTSNVVPKSGMVFIDYENGKLLLMEVYKD